MSEATATNGRPWALVRTVGAYSGGTRVQIIEPGQTATVRVLATDDVIEVKATDLVKLRSGLLP